MKKTLRASCLILLSVSLLSAQAWKGKGRIPGVVVDEQGRPVEGVAVKFACPEFSGGAPTAVRTFD